MGAELTTVFVTIAHAAAEGSSSAAIYTCPNGKRAIVKEILAVPDRSQCALYVGRSGQAVLGTVASNTTCSARIISAASANYQQLTNNTMTASAINIFARNTVLESGDYIAIWSNEAGAATLNINVGISVLEN